MPFGHGQGHAYGRGHGKGKPIKNPPNQPPQPPYEPPYEPLPPPIDDDMSQNCFGSACQPKTVKKRNVLQFRTRGVRGIRRNR